MKCVGAASVGLDGLVACRWGGFTSEELSLAETEVGFPSRCSTFCFKQKHTCQAMIISMEAGSFFCRVWNETRLRAWFEIPIGRFSLSLCYFTKLPILGADCSLAWKALACFNHTSKFWTWSNWALLWLGVTQPKSQYRHNPTISIQDIGHFSWFWMVIYIYILIFIYLVKYSRDPSIM